MFLTGLQGTGAITPRKRQIPMNDELEAATAEDRKLELSQATGPTHDTPI